MISYLARLIALSSAVLFIIAMPHRIAVAAAAGCATIAPPLLDRCLRTPVTGGRLMLAQAAPQDNELSAEQRARLKAEIARVPSDLRGRFDVRYRAWKYSWRRKPILFNTRTARGTAEFRALVALGPGILPLLVDRLVRRDEYAALQAYDALQDKPDLRVDPQNYPSEQQRALETARRWLART